MHRRRVLRVLGIVAALLILVAISLPFLISANRFKPKLESTLSAALGRRVTIGDLKFSVLSGGLTAKGLAIADDPAFGNTPFLQAKSLDAGVKLRPLIFSRKLNVTGLTINQPQVRLLQAPSGRWNYSSLGGSKPARGAAPAPSSPGKEGIELSANLVRMVDGRISMNQIRGRQKPLALDRVNLEVRNFSAASAFPFSLTAGVVGGGDIKLDGNAGPIDAADLALTPFSTTVDIARLNLAALAGTAPNVAGIASFQGNGRSAGGRLTLGGKMRADGLKLAKNGSPARNPVEFDFVLVDDIHEHAGLLQRGDFRVGRAVASLTGTFAQRGRSTELDLKLAGRNMPVPDVAGLLPPLGIALPAGSRLEGGVATAVFTVKGPADRAVANGSFVLNNTRLANFDLGSKMALMEALAGIKSGRDTDIQTFSANLLITPGGTTVRDLRLVAPSIGELKGGGAISPTNALDFKMSATVQTTRSAALSHIAIPFTIQGTTANPVFTPDLEALTEEQTRALLEAAAQKQLQGNAGQDVTNALDQLLGGKKK